jgi:hypothetical protein
VPLVTLGLAILLLCAGLLALHQLQQGEQGVSGAASYQVLDGSHLLSVVETPDSEELYPAGSDYLNTLFQGLFLVSLGLLLGAGLAGSVSERRLLELRRLPSSTPLARYRPPLSKLEVFRL